MTEKNNHNEKQLPKDWKWVKLEQIAKWGSGGTPTSTNPYYYNGNIPWLIIGDLNDGSIHNSQKKITKLGLDNSSAKMVQPESVLIAMYGSIGKLGINKIPVATNQAIAFTEKLNEGIINKFLFHYLFHIRSKLHSLGKGGTQKNISQTVLKKVDFPLPPKPTQTAIVSKIEELFSELDKGIEQLKTAQQQLKTYRQAVLKWAFEGKLTEEWRLQQKILISAKGLLNKIQIEKEKIAKGSNKKVKPLVPLTNEELEELFEIPKEWAWAKNEEYLFEVKDGTHDTPKYFDSGIPFVTQKNIREHGLDFANMQFISKEDHTKFYQRSNVSKGDILISMIGHNRGMTAIVDTEKVFSIKNVGLLKFLSQLQSNKFSFYYYQSRVGLNIVLRKSKGGAQPFIGLTELRNWPVAVCSLEEQNEVVQAIENRLSVADKMEESISQSLQQAEALRQSILKKAFEGRLILEESANEVQAIAKVIPIEREVLAGKIIHLMHDKKHFGLTKFQKMFYLVENFSQVEYETNFIRERAGPYDKEFTKSFKNDMQVNDWFSEEHKGSMIKFIPGDNVGSLIVKYGQHFRSKGPKITFVIQQLQDKSTHEAELIATLYAVWNNRLIKKKPVNIKHLIEDFFNWSPKKKDEFQEEEVAMIYKWMKKIKLMPSGFGRAIEHGNG